MLRIKDPERSLAFYTGVLGMRLSAMLSFEAQRFSLYFLEFGETALPADEADRLEDVFSRPSFLELTHNHGERKRMGGGGGVGEKRFFSAGKKTKKKKKTKK